MELKFSSNITILIGQGLSQDDYNVLSLLYLPIIGKDSYSIYMIMISLLSRNANKVNLTQSEINDMLGLKIDEFVSIRKKLEAIGLMNTYYKKNEFVYLLKAPLSARQFFNDGVLSVYLKNAVGEDLFLKLVETFKVEKFNKDGYVNITELFDNVYNIEEEEIEINVDGYLLDKNINSSIKKGQFEFDYDEFVNTLNLTLNEKNKLTSSFEKLINDTAYTYKLTIDDMQKIYYRSLVDEEFSIAKFAKESKQLYKSKSTKVEATGIERLKYLDPYDILKIVVKNATSSDYLIIKDVINYSKLDKPITNLVIFQVLNKNDAVCPKFEYFVKAFETFRINKIDTFEKGVKFVVDQGLGIFNVPEKKENNEKPKSTGSAWLDNFNDKYKK